MIEQQSIITWIIVTPLVGAVLVLACGKWPNIREAITLTTATVLFTLVVSLYDAVMAGERAAVTWVNMLPEIPLAFSVEPLGMLFALVASFLWIITSIYAIGYMRGHHEKNQTRFYVCFALAISSVMAIAFAENLLTLFIFYEVLTLSTYPLVTHAGTEAAKRGGRTYLGILLFTSIAFLLFAILLTWNIAGTLSFQAGGVFSSDVSKMALGILLALYCFGIGKAALMPFHRWLPSAMVAPTPVSALLHAVAVVKAGVFTVLKVVVYIFGIDLVSSIPIADVLLYIAALTVLLASCIAVTKDNLKARLAYSTVSQLSYIIVGALLATSAGVLGGAMHIATHALGKITLFFCAGAIMVASHKTEISDMAGLGRAMPFTMLAFLIGSISIIGLPPMGGTWSKWFLAIGALEAEQLAIVVILMISSLLNIAYLLPIPIRAFYRGDKSGSMLTDGALGSEHQAKTARLKEAPVACLIAMGVTATGCLVMFFYPTPLFELVGRIPLGTQP
ncbi:NADH dehydrogenase (quinone) [Oleiphilus messinensis]|uniref:NADH dehydrogenase (Quinone) n=1 Tax=Oleiphilus messinensis TaxID=141451 RepID=A0A1Y0IB69_9GAMM|nr:monovalent cation/H+ antiporter subunit D family protein [Oleiphilus messinensis]ARU57772.1 NADH dehydrogenase (quinone) [Oleiphilus messinensis]